MDASIKALKADIRQRTQLGINHLAAELIIWCIFVVITLIPDPDMDKALVYLAAAVAAWPLALVVGRLLRLNLLGRGNPLCVLYLIVCVLPLIFAPILIGDYFVSPEALPWALGIVVGVQFLLFAWIFDSSAYLFCALGMLEAAALIGWLAPGLAYLATPPIVSSILLLTAYFLLRGNATRSVPPAG